MSEETPNYSLDADVCATCRHDRGSHRPLGCVDCAEDELTDSDGTASVDPEHDFVLVRAVADAEARRRQSMGGSTPTLRASHRRDASTRVNPDDVPQPSDLRVCRLCERRGVRREFNRNQDIAQHLNRSHDDAAFRNPRWRELLVIYEEREEHERR